MADTAPGQTVIELVPETGLGAWLGAIAAPPGRAMSTPPSYVAVSGVLDVPGRDQSAWASAAGTVRAFGSGVLACWSPRSTHADTIRALVEHGELDGVLLRDGEPTAAYEPDRTGGDTPAAQIERVIGTTGCLVVADRGVLDHRCGTLVLEHGWGERLGSYVATDPLYRSGRHHDLVSCLSCVGGGGPAVVLPLLLGLDGAPALAAGIPGDDWQRAATVRLLLGFAITAPGHTLVAGVADPSLVAAPFGDGLLRWWAQLRDLARHDPALCGDGGPDDQRIVVPDDDQQSCVAFLRGARSDRPVLVAANFTPVPRHNYRVGVPVGGSWEEIANSDAAEHGGSGQGNLGAADAVPVGVHGEPWSLNLVLPPLGLVALRAPG